MLALPVGAATGLFIIWFLRQGFDDRPDAPWYRASYWFLQMLPEMLVMFSPFLAWPHKVPRRILIAVLVYTWVSNCIATSLRSWCSPVNFMDRKIPEKTFLCYKLVWGIGNTQFWFNSVVFVPMIFHWYTPQSQAPVPDSSRIADAETQSPTRVRRPLSPLGYVAMLSAAISCVFLLLDVLGIDLLTYMSAYLVAWAFFIWQEARKKRGLTHDVGYMMMIVLISAGVPTGAGALCMSLMSSVGAFEEPLRTVMQPVVFFAWSFMMFVLRNLMRRSLAYGIDEKHAMPFLFPILWIEHLISKLLFLSEMSVTVIVIVVATSIARAMLRDTGYWRDAVRWALRRPSVSCHQRHLELREQQVWLEMNASNAISAGLIPLFLAADRDFGFGGVDTLSVVRYIPRHIPPASHAPFLRYRISVSNTSKGIQNDHVRVLYIVYSAMFVLLVISHVISSYVLVWRLKKTGEEVKLAEPTPHVEVQTVASFWRTYRVYYLGVAVWACMQCVWQTVGVRKALFK